MLSEGGMGGVYKAESPEEKAIFSVKELIKKKSIGREWLGRV
jgi:hypothetical protein